MDSVSFLRLLRLASPALPIGAFAYSQGLEWAVEAGWVHDAASCAHWLDGLVTQSMAGLDLPALARMHAAWATGDTRTAMAESAALLAFRDNGEARQEDRQLGASLAAILADEDEAALARDARTLLAAPGSLTCACAFALAGARWGIEVRSCLLALAWMVAESQTMAAIKLVPLGQKAGQRILSGLTAPMAAAVDSALADVHAKAFSNTPGRALAQLRHAGQRVRLFRS
jgi:urease accessory protein